MKQRNDIEVLIDGRKYTICGFESDEYLQQVAGYINRKFTEFKKKDYYSRLDLDLRNVLLAINIADDYFKTRKKMQEYKGEVENRDKLILDMKHEIIQLKDKLKKTENKADELEASLEAAEKKLIELDTRLKHKR